MSAHSTKIRRMLGVVLATATLSAIGFGLTVMAVDATPAPPVCSTEDSDNCVWDAELNGNGQGRSFEVRDGVVYYEDGSVPLCTDEIADAGGTCLGTVEHFKEGGK